jgi:hypothetical protein
LPWARILYNLMRHGIAYMRKEEATYAEQERERLERQLQRRAKELGYELKELDPPLETVLPDGEIVSAWVTATGAELTRDEARRD